jgi:hypothetical protein
VPHKQTKRDSRVESILDCVPALLKERKWFDVSLDTILKKIEDGERVELQTVHETTDEKNGECLRLPIRLRISGKPKYSAGWHVTLLLYNRRIDGFGYEERFCDINQVEQSGLHRHVWNGRSQDAAGKISVSVFDRENLSFRDFLMWSFKAIGVSYPKDDDYELS